MYKNIILFILCCFWMAASLGFYNVFGFQSSCWLFLSILTWQGGIKRLMFGGKKNDDI
jgi:hypothetical protein